MKTKGIYFLYRLCQSISWPLLLSYLLYRVAKNPAYLRTLPERFGFLPRTWRQRTPGTIWIHSVSVGEVLACLEVVRRIRAEFPRTPVFVSVSTLAGRQIADDRLAGVAEVFYAPLDFAFAVRRVLRMLRPSLVVVAETEIWPNLFREVKRIDCGLLIVNGRISDRAAPRYLRHAWFFKHVLCSPDRILVQTETMRKRFIASGAPPERVAVGGNLKFDFQPQVSDGNLIQRFQPEHVWIAASTMPPATPTDPDEDDAVIESFRRLADRYPRLLLVLAPRRPERFDAAAAKLQRSGVAFVRRTALADLRLPGVLLLDTIGELSGLFAAADVVFMGGSLASRGGHNILEPAFFAKPVIVGPRMENFQAIADQFREARAMVEIGAAHELAPAVDKLFQDPGSMGARARRCAEANRGASERAMKEIRTLYRTCHPWYRRSTPELLILAPLAALWRAEARRRVSRQLRMRRRLDAPVISIGNIVMGGTGKTPMAVWLSEALQDVRPAILTRGYGRYSTQKYLILPAGAKAHVHETGDEPQIFLRSGVAAVGIGPNRARAGQMLLERLGPHVLLLDDGFQHVRLARDLDLLLIDALYPLGGRRVFPMGRLREPLDALGRADAFVVTRTECARNLDAVEHQLRRWNERAPIFHARTVVESWRRYPDGAAVTPPKRVGAFCGLGNPDSFWCTLAENGIDTAAHFEFGDHHFYRPSQIRRMGDEFRRVDAEAAVTTEKDIANVCEGCLDLLAPLPLLYLEITMQIEEREELLALVRAAIS